MPITPTYPGIYIQELPSSAHTITAAATSVTAFVGYTHPFKTNPANWLKAVRIFSFTDYEREFGGLYASGALESHVANAVNQFFLNGGSDAYVIALQPHFYDMSVTPPTDQGAVKAASLPLGGGTGMTFTALEPTDLIPMTLTISNLQKTAAANDTADIVITYGSRAETFRKVTLIPAGPNYIDKAINGISQLVKVAPTTPPNYPTTFTAVNQANFGYSAGYPGATWATFNAADFAPVFQQDSSLDKADIFNLLVLPGVADQSVWSEALAFCERKQAFLIMDPPKQDSADGMNGLPLIHDDMDALVPKSANGALYFPYLRTTDQVTGGAAELPPSGYVAGVYARTDVNRGVWKAPAGLETTLLNTSGVVERGRMTDPRQGTLNPKGVNCLRDFAGIGTVVFGARTLVTENPAFQQWRYVPVRRMALFLEQTLYRNLGWVVFEPNAEPLWVAIRTTIENFMLSLFQQGAFQGVTPSQAFQVKCDSSTTTQQDIDNGIVNIVVGFAPLKPAEFVIIKIAQLAGQTQA
ncbi:MAG: phage tail sheath subtilisin-like domain-containing protein [Acidobacteriia bacterium]|nr:phage tail sheath subtilisin-like domain-containing protein [Terriglobia bacterium]